MSNQANNPSTGNANQAGGTGMQNMGANAVAAPANFVPPNQNNHNNSRARMQVHPISTRAIVNSSLLLDNLHREMNRQLGRTAYFLGDTERHPEEEIDPKKLTDLKIIWEPGYKFGTVKRISKYTPMEEVIALWPELPWDQGVIADIFLRSITIDEKVKSLMEYLPGTSDHERDIAIRAKRREYMENKNRISPSSNQSTPKFCSGNSGGVALRLRDPNTGRSVNLDFTKENAPSVKELGFDPSDPQQLMQVVQINNSKLNAIGSNKPEYDVFGQQPQEKHEPPRYPVDPSSHFESWKKEQPKNEEDVYLALRRRQQEELAQGINEKAERAREAAVKAIKMKDVAKEAAAKQAAREAQREAAAREAAAAAAEAMQLAEAANSISHYSSSIRSDNIKRRPSPLNLRDPPRKDQYAQDLPSINHHAQQAVDRLDERHMRLGIMKSKRVREHYLKEQPELCDQEREMMYMNVRSSNMLSQHWPAHNIQTELRAAQLRARIPAPVPVSSPVSGIHPDAHHHHHGYSHMHAPEHTSGGVHMGTGMNNLNTYTPVHMSNGTVQLVPNMATDGGWVQLPAVPISQHTTPHLAMFKDYRRNLEARGDYY